MEIAVFPPPLSESESNFEIDWRKIFSFCNSPTNYFFLWFFLSPSLSSSPPSSPCLENWWMKNIFKNEINFSKNYYVINQAKKKYSNLLLINSEKKKTRPCFIWTNFYTPFSTDKIIFFFLFKKLVICTLTLSSGFAF